MATIPSQKPVAVWLLICCATIFAMVVLGGVTRLTGSGLSMVEWAPIMGVLPPLNQEQWEETFRLYQQFPEYRLKNFAMGLQEFKTIFWFEYAHRLLGRLIGVIFLVPLIYFAVRKRIDRALIPKLVIMFILGGLQGLLGWYMVKSGLVQDPHVSQYRLTAHLGFAFIIYAFMFWIALDLLYARSRPLFDQRSPRPTGFSWVVTVLVFVTALSGGFVAGLKAGLAYNTFPLMGGRLIPEGILNLEPVWLNFFENVTTVQFDHRLLATLLFVLIPLFWWRARRVDLPSRLRVGLNLLLAMLGIQIVLGISTLLMYVPVTLAAAHQGGALVLLTISLFVNHQMKHA